MDQGRDLSLGRLDDPRMAVTGAGHADTGGEVEVSTVVLIIEVDALAASGDDAGCLLQCM